MVEMHAGTPGLEFGSSGDNGEGLYNVNGLSGWWVFELESYSSCKDPTDAESEGKKVEYRDETTGSRERVEKMGGYGGTVSDLLLKRIYNPRLDWWRGKLCVESLSFV